MNRRTQYFFISFFWSLIAINGQSAFLSKSDSVLQKINLNRTNDSLFIKYSRDVSWLLINEQKVDLGLKYCDSALIRSRVIKNRRFEALTYNTIGNNLKSLGDYNKAINSFKEAIKINVEINNPEGLSSSYLNLGNVYFALESYLKAEKCYSIALVEYEKVIKKDTVDLANIHNNLSGIYWAQKKIDKAKESLQRAYNLYKLKNDEDGIASALNNFGFLEMARGNKEQALVYFNEALPHKINIGNNDEIADSYVTISLMYEQLKQPQKALAQALNSLKHIDTSLSIPIVEKVFTQIANCYEINGNTKKAIEYYKKVKEISKNVMSKQLSEQIDDAEKKRRSDQLRYRDSLTQQSKIQTQQLQLEKDSLTKWFLVAIILIAIVFTAILYKRFLVIKKQRHEIFSQKEIIEVHQKETIDSINYAKRIQHTLLANNEFLEQHLGDYFIYFQPKDIVSGDFYWAAKHNDLIYIAVCDSTGHGVPGAFMSLLNIGFLNEAINEKKITQPDLVFNYVRNRLIETISKDGQKDGFDGVLICIDKSRSLLTYASANTVPVIISDNQLIELSKNRMPVGKGELVGDFTLYSQSYKTGDILFLYTDGYADQFGGPKGKKFKYKQLNELLFANRHLSLIEQLKQIEKEFKAWQGPSEQIDDVCVMGLKL